MRMIKSKRIGIILLGLLCAICFAFASAPLWKAQAAEIEATGKVELYQLAPGVILNEGYVIKTANDKLVVIDGGASNGENAAYLDAALTAIAGTENYVVDTWFLSHAHSDHIYELAKMLSEDTINFTVNQFVFDFPNFIQSGENWVADFQAVCALGGDATSWNLLKTGLDNYAAKKGITVKGASYYDDLNGAVVNSAALENGPIVITVDGVDFEILQTFSTSDTQVNSNSMVIRAWVDGQSVLFLNDATVESGNRLIGTYGRDYLKSDIVQMAHHGQNGTAKNVYDAVDAKVRLWPNFSQIWTGESYQTGEVRTWVGLPEKAEDYVASEYDIVAALAENPTDLYSVEAWANVLDGMKISLPYLPAVENKFQMKEGASIRLTAGSTGIRFGAELASYDPDATYGFVIAPRAWFDSLNVTSNYTAALIAQKGEANIIKLTSNVLEEGSHFFIQGSIANILDKNINLQFTGMAYCYKNGVYTDAYIGSLDDITRSVADVATGAFNHHTYVEETFDATDLGVVKGFVDKAVGGAEYALGFENATVALDVYGDKVLTTNGNVGINNAKWTSNNESVAKVVDGKVYAYGAGQATITVESMGKTANCTVNVTNEADAVLSFSGEASEVAVSSVPSSIRPSRGASLVEAEWLESYKGANGVLKVNAVSQSYAPYVADIRIELPVAIDTSSGVTVRYLIEKHDAPWFSFYDGSSDGAYDYLGHVALNKALLENEKGIWNVIYLPFTTVGDDNSALNILIQAGSAFFEHEVYFDIIESGNTTANYDIMDTYGAIADPLADKLTGKYLADFSDDSYEKLIINDTYGRKAEAITAERLEIYDGSPNVLKVTTKNDGSGSCFGDFTMILPKAMGDTGYTIRFMLASTTSTGPLRILNPRTEVSKIKEYYPMTDIVGKWVEVFVPYTGAYKNEVTFQTYGNADGVNVFYIDYVADGDCVAEMEAARKEEQLGSLADRLTGDYLADFSESAYVYTVGYSGSPNVASSITTEYLASYTDASGSPADGVLKITAVSAGNGRGNIVINLPKESASGIMTVKFMVPTCNSTYNGFIDPGTNADLVSSQFTTSTAWQYMVINQSACERDRIEILFANAASVTNVVYIAAIIEGDQVEYLKNEAINANLNQLANGLADGEIANFSSDGYEMLLGEQLYAGVGAADSQYYAASSLVAERLATFGAETNVLKVTATTSYGGFSLRLPKAIGAEGFTIRFMIEQMAGDTAIFQILTPYTFAGKVWEIYDSGATKNVTANIGKWISVYVSGYASSTYEDVNNYVDFRLYTPSSSTKVVYIDEILVGNQVEAMENRTDRNLVAETSETLAAGLTDSYLADFSSDAYADLVYARNGANRAATSVTAERLSVFEGQSNVLKITTVNSGLGVGDVKILLPKASTTGQITVKFWVESASSSVWFLQPNTNSGAYEYVDGKSGSVSFIKNGTSVDKTGSWQTMTLYYNNIAIRDQLDMIFAGGASGATNTIYLAYVVDGAEAIASASALFNGNETFMLFADKPPQGDTTRIADYKDAGFTHYVITEDQKSLFAKSTETGEYLVDGSGNYILNTEYLGFINNAINAGLEVIMRNMGNKTNYFDALTAEHIATLQALIDGYYMCDEPSHVYASGYTGSTYVAALESLVNWYNTNGKDENGDYTLFHVNLLQSYGIEEIVHKGQNITFEQYVENYVETILKKVNGPKTISTDFYALSTDGVNNYVKSDFLRNLYVIANAAKELKATGHDITVNHYVQLCGNAGLSLRPMSSINDVRFQTALYAAFGATSIVYYGYLGDMYDQSQLIKYDNYQYVKTVNAELQNFAKAISAFDWNGFKFLSKGDSEVTNISGSQLSSFADISGVTSTRDAVVSEFVSGSEYAYMAVNYVEPSSNAANTVTFTLNGQTQATVFVNGVRSDVEIVNNTYSVTLNAGDYVFIYPYN